MAWKRLLPEEKPTFGRALLMGLAGVVVGVLLRVALEPALGTELPYITFFPLLLAVSVWGGTGAGLVCLGLSCVAAAVFFLPSGNVLHIANVSVAYVLSGGALALVGSALASTVRELKLSQRRMKAAEAELQTLVSELAHRARNGLTVVMSIISQSARKVSTAQELADIVHGRLNAMAEAQNEVIRGGGDSAPLGSLLQRTLAPFDLDRFVFETSPGLDVPRETATALALLTHELATNAFKHGALSHPGGRVELGWEAATGTVRLMWRERGGPPAHEPRREGFGTRLLNVALVAQGGHAERRFDPDGMVCEIAFPSAEPALRS